MRVDISVVIPTMNRPQSLLRTIDFIVSGNSIPSQIIIIDQSQTEELQLANKSVVELYNKRLGGFEYHYQSLPSLTKARNYGYSFVKYEIVVFSDDDVDVNKNTFFNIVNLFSNEKLAMVGGVNEGDEDVPASNLSCIFGMASFFKKNIGHVARGCYGRFPSSCADETPSEWAMGFFFVVKKSLLDKWNLRFDENLKSYAYAEDLDFSYGYYLRASLEGLICIMSRKVVVKHNVSKEYRIPSRKHIFMTVLHRYYISNKYKLPLFEINVFWSNLGLFFMMLAKNENPRNLFDAQVFYWRNRNEILKGNFLLEKW